MFKPGFFRIAILVLGMACIFSSGCALNRSEVSLDYPEYPAEDANPSARPAVIRNVNDLRVFEADPDDPATPSLKYGSADKASDEVKSRAIGRKRNTYGWALGDILLREGQTVTGVVSDNLAVALAELGYRVVTGTPAPDSAKVFDVDILKFWAWGDPGWTVDIYGDIDVALRSTAPDRVVNISVQGNSDHQLVTNGDWANVLTEALELFRREVVSRLGGVTE